MPIAQLQAETARATGIYTWATKPSASGNTGLEIIVSDYTNSRWRSDGTYWRPVGGRAVMRNWVGANVTFSSGGYAIISAVPALVLPADLVDTLGLSIRNRVQWHREAAAAAANQSGEMRIGVSVGSRALGRAGVSGLTANQKWLLDETRTINTGLTTYSSPLVISTGQPVVAETYEPNTVSTIAGATIRLNGQGVDSGGSDVWYIDQWLTEIYA